MAKTVMAQTGLYVTVILHPGTTYAERFVGISGSREGLLQLPDGDFLPPMEMNCLEKFVAGNIKDKFTDGRRMIIGR